MIAALIALSVGIAGYSVFGQHQNPGTFQAVQDGGSIIRVDTRTGAMERCLVAGNHVQCSPMTASRN